MTLNPLDRSYMQRCFELALKGGKKVRPNPEVGAVLVYRNRIIGEGWHREFGGAHAEVNCLASVKEADRKFISQSTLYVSLEPCSFHGKTPACTHLIRQNKIPRVVISTLDPNPMVNGNGVEALRKQDVDLETGVLEERGKDLVRGFRINQLEKRPYIILKIVKSRHHYIGKKGERIWLSTPYSTLLSHKWRAETEGILVGTETALNDDPSLDNRLFSGDSPVRIAPDRQNRLAGGLKILDGKQRTLLFRQSPDNRQLPNTEQILFDFKLPDPLIRMMGHLFERGIYTLLVEGGARLIRSFLQAGLWDEARIIQTSHPLSDGIKAPNIHGKLHQHHFIGTDEYLQIYREI